MKVLYEWTAEEVDENGETVAQWMHGESYVELMRTVSVPPRTPGAMWDTVLLRDELDPITGELKQRTQAFLFEGKLDTVFSFLNDTPTRVLVPRRFHREVSRG